MRLCFLIRAMVFVCSGLMGGATYAQSAPEPVVLTVTGLDQTYTYSVADLARIDEVTFETSTIWTDGIQVFTGVPLAAFVKSLDVSDGELTAMAINDYAISMPVDEALLDGPMIAYLRNGDPMSIRNKGPLWLVYPYDSDPAFQNEVVHARSIWQLDRISIQTE